MMFDTEICIFPTEGNVSLGHANPRGDSQHFPMCTLGELRLSLNMYDDIRVI